jgi:BirA family transcriptional regulator, biotin operon repressor / biotin---[acetyl-CoA-carboxylase] ligase
MPNHESDGRQAAEPEALPLRLDEVRDGLTTKRIGTEFHYFSELDSTNIFARRLAEQGRPAGEIVIAEEQTQGRGRLGRSWISPPYVNLYLSIVLRPELPPAHAPQITLMAAVALAETVASFVSFPALIKWPNDILVNGKKVAGILTEASSTSERIDFVILGMGINLNFPEAWMPEAIRQRATSLLIATQNIIRREVFLRRLIQGLDRCYGILEDSGFGAIAPRWEARFGLRDRRVRVDMIDGPIFGKAIGIDRDGALIVETDNGKFQRVIAGDVIPMEDK